MSERLSYTAAEMAEVVAERDRLRSQLAALSEECGPSCASEMKASNDERDRLRRFVTLVREADAAKHVRGEVALVTAAIKWLDEQQKT